MRGPTLTRCVMRYSPGRCAGAIHHFKSASFSWFWYWFSFFVFFLVSFGLHSPNKSMEPTGASRSDNSRFGSCGQLAPAAHAHR